MRRWRQFISEKKQCSTLKRWHDAVGHVDPTAMKLLEARGLIDVTDTAVASEIGCSACKDGKSEGLRYGRGGRSLKALREISYTDLGGLSTPT